MSSSLRPTPHHPRVGSYVAEGLRGRLVRESTRFTFREFAVGLRERRARRSAGPSEREPDAVPGRAGSPDASPDRAYRVRESGLRVLIAHRTPDVLTLDEIFRQRVYEPPAAVTARLNQLGRPLRAVDLGANVGLWGIWLHGRFPVGQLTALEPEPDNAAKHRRVIELNRLGGSWELIEAAAACADGPLPFTPGHATMGHIAEHGAPGTIAVAGRDSFPLLDGVDLLKMDIEGAEWPILLDPRMVDVEVPIVLLEYHPEGSPTGNPEADAHRALAAAGYTTWHTHGIAQGTGVMWGLRA
jgi:FkbM family methyltransferase